MEVKFEVFEIIQRDLLRKGNWETDYGPMETSIPILEYCNLEAPTMDAAAKLLEESTLKGYFTILPMYVKE